MSSNIYKEIKSDYDNLRKEAHQAVVVKRAEIYKEIPEIEKIETKIQKTGLQLNRIIIQKGDDSKEQARELNNRLEKLKTQKAEFLNKNGYDKNHLQPEYSCNKCNDTGISIDGIRCSCYNIKLVEKLHDISNVKLGRDESWASFNADYYPDEINKNQYGMDKSPRQNILNIKKMCQNFAVNIENSNQKNLIFTGPTGAGKTFMAKCIARDVIDRGIAVLYQTAPALFNTISRYRSMSFKDNEYDETSYSSIYNVKLLVIDDLGTESQTTARYAELLNILNIRASNQYKTIISTNMGIEQLKDNYSERVVSRIIGSFSIMRFAGNDIRVLKTLTS